MARLLTIDAGGRAADRSVRCPVCEDTMGKVVMRCETGGITTETRQCPHGHRGEVRY